MLEKVREACSDYHMPIKVDYSGVHQLVNINSGTTISRENSQMLSPGDRTPQHVQSHSSISNRSSTRNSKQVGAHVAKINFMERARKRSQLNKYGKDLSRNMQ